MAQKATKGSQSIDVDTHNARRRAAKARKHANRKAEAARKNVAQDNHRLGFKFARNDNLPEVLAAQEQNNLVEEQNNLVELSDPVFRRDIDALNRGQRLVFTLGDEELEALSAGDLTTKIYTFARERLLEVCKALPEKYGMLVHDGKIYVQMVRSAAA